MKAQELRDKVAAVRDFTVLVNLKPITEVVIDIANKLVMISTEKKEEVKKIGT
jgi:hypothetical protein